MMLTSPMFVLQRRINQPLGSIERVLCDPHQMSAGTGNQVEVRSRFSGRWISGFEVAEMLAHDRYLLRRRSDGAVLPVAFPAREVRPRVE